MSRTLPAHTSQINAKFDNSEAKTKQATRQGLEKVLLRGSVRCEVGRGHDGAATRVLVRPDLLLGPHSPLTIHCCIHHHAITDPIP